MKKLLIALILISCGSPSDATQEAQADAIPYNVVHVGGNGGLFVSELDSVLEWAEREWAVYLPVPLELARRDFVSVDPSGIGQRLEHWNEGVSLYWWRKWMRDNNYSSWDRLSLVVHGPLIEGDHFYFGGWGTCSSFRVDRHIHSAAVAWCGPWSSHTPPRLRDYACVIIIIHEFLHNLGAKHIEGECVMAADAGKYMDSHYGKLPICPETIERVTNHLNKHNRRLIRQAKKKYFKWKGVRSKRAAKYRAILRYRAKHYFRQRERP